MTFIPTKEELKKLGFLSEEQIGGWFFYEKDYITFDGETWNVNSSIIYPQSLEDLKTLIRLLTPPHEN